MKEKLSNILIIFLALFLFLFITSKKESDEDNQRVNKIEQELMQKESWLISELEDISNFMSFQKGNIVYHNRKVQFISRFASPEFDIERLAELDDYLLEKDWIDMTDRIDRNDYIIVTSSKSEETAKYVKILCKNKATIFMYMTDMQYDYIIDDFKVRTLIQLKYNYSLPCYDL